MQSIGMAGVPTSDIYSDGPIFSLQGKSGWYKKVFFTLRANFWQQFSTSQMTSVSSYDEDTNIVPIKQT